MTIKPRAHDLPSSLTRSMLGTMASESLTHVTATPLHFFLLGATGRTGSLFLTQALSRGHVVTAFVRNASRLPAAVNAHPNLRVVTGELHEADKMLRAMKKITPDAVYIMLASEVAPYTAVSTGTESVLFALRELHATHPANQKTIPLISIAAWGLGPTAGYIKGLFSRWIVGVAKRSFWAKPFADFERQLADIEGAPGIIIPIIILPPILNNREKSNSYLSGDASAMRNVMGITNTVSRASIADLCLKLGENVVSGHKIPQWIAITNP
jgi:hypothetical protein